MNQSLDLHLVRNKLWRSTNFLQTFANLVLFYCEQLFNSLKLSHGTNQLLSISLTFNHYFSLVEKFLRLQPYCVHTSFVNSVIKFGIISYCGPFSTTLSFQRFAECGEHG
jgi:hypothetical protein